MHEMNLQNKYFDYIKNGTKRIELRLFDEKRSKVKLNDTIIFKNENNESLNVTVTGLYRSISFEKLFEDFNIDVLASNEMTKEELLNVLEEFYTKEKQDKYGVLGIRIKI